MKKRFLPVLLAAGLAASAHATTYNGNGNNDFNGAVGNGTLNITNNASGAFVFAFTLGGTQTNFNTNDLVIYLDNGKGGGIGISTASLTDVGDGGRSATSEYTATQDNGGPGRSTLSFGALMNPVFALDIQTGDASVYGLVNNGSFNFAGGQQLGGNSTGGVTFTSAVVGGRTVLTETVPAADLGLTANAAATLKFVGIEVSEIGYSSNEATVGLTGSNGWGNTQTISGVNVYAVPEPGAWGWLLLGAGGLALVQRRRRATASRDR